MNETLFLSLIAVLFFNHKDTQWNELSINIFKYAILGNSSLVSLILLGNLTLLNFIVVSILNFWQRIRSRGRNNSSTLGKTKKTKIIKLKEPSEAHIKRKGNYLSISFVVFNGFNKCVTIPIEDNSVVSKAKMMNQNSQVSISIYPKEASLKDKGRE